MFEPWTIRTGAGGPYKVFTPFWRACLESGEPQMPSGAPGKLPQPARNDDGALPHSDDLDGWGLLPRTPDWRPPAPGWSFGAGAQRESSRS
jgi:deoxyribodipyrimidine photo-lyase